MSDWLTRQSLIKRATDPDDNQAWDEFVSYYSEFIQVVLTQLKLNKNDMEDLKQEILMRIWKVLPDYDPSRAGFRTWMGHIIRNKVIDHYRKVQRTNEKHENLQREMKHLNGAFTESEVEAVVEREWEVHVVKLALGRIQSHFSDRAMTAFDLSMNDWSSEDIGKKLEIKPNSVNKLKNRVKQRLMEEVAFLRRELEHHDADPRRGA